MEDIIVGIHQPNFMPWMGFFNKIDQSDVFVLIDDVQYAKGSVCNRTRLKDITGTPFWLTVPVSLEMGSSSTFNQVKIAEVKWYKKALNLVREYYMKAPYYDLFYPEIEKLVSAEYQSLAELNVTLIKYFCSKLLIDTPIYLQSKLNMDFGKNNQLNLGITRHFKGTIYLSGTGAKKYNDHDLFVAQGVELKYQDFTPPPYRQINGDFIEGLSILDLIFNEGETSAKFIRSILN